jgi:hypothetical protein
LSKKRIRNVNTAAFLKTINDLKVKCQKTNKVDTIMNSRKPSVYQPVKNKQQQVRIMKALINLKSNIKSLWRLCFLLPVLFISSCIQPTIFNVQFPESGATYIGNELVDFVITYSKTVPRADVYLNGVSISDEFVYGANSASASVTNLKKYVKQGVNTLTIDPLAFGPSVKFVVDNAGPVIIITKGVTTGNSSFVEIEGELRDVSGISSLVLQLDKVTSINQTTGIVTRAQIGSDIVIPVDAAGKFKRTGIDISDGVSIYSFEAIDIHGQKTIKEFLADSNENPVMAISNAMRIAIGDSFVESLRPIIAAQLYTTLQNAPIDIRNVCWNDPNIDSSVSQNPNGGFCASGSTGLTPVSANTTQDGGTFNSGLNPVYASILGIPMTINVKRINMQPNVSTVLLNKFKVQANNYLDIDMIITEMLVSLRIDLRILFFNITVDPMTMTIGKIVVDTGAIATALNKKVNVQLADSNFDLQDISVSQTSIGGINIGGLVDILMPLIEGIIGGLLPGILNPILNDNLEKIVIGACMYPKDNVTNVPCNDPSSSAKFNWSVNVETLKTDNLFGAGSPYDMIVGLETQFNLLDADLFARPALGAVYIEDPIDIGLIYNSLGETGTNLTVAISSNAMNQAFSALYASGYTHLTFANGVVSYGANPALPAGVDGDVRIRLYPESPPFFTLNPVDGGIGGAAAARVGYESAVLYLDNNEDGIWKTQLQLGVDFSIAASIGQVDNAVRLGVAGSPTFNLNTMVNNTGLPVTQGMLQTMLDAVTQYFLPEITDQFIVIDLAQLADDAFNGTQVLYQTDSDTRTQTLTNGGCPLATNTAGGDGRLDYVCEVVNFVVNTNTLTSAGNKGTNLLFQMEARDPDIPAASAIPRFDLDGDGVLDFQDNCAAPILMQVAAIKIEGGLTSANIDINGLPINNFENRIKAHINRWVAQTQGINPSVGGNTPGDYLATPTPIAGAGQPVSPTVTDIAWWNVMRKGDTAVNSLGAYPWITMLYSNKNQRNIDGDRIGDLCEDDTDRDGIYLGNGSPEDSCPTVNDPSNNPGACTIDSADFVMFKNQNTLTCMTHAGFMGEDDPGGIQNFTPGSSTAGRQLQWAACNVDDLNQRFYVALSPSDSDPGLKRPTVNCGTGCEQQPRIIYIYTNENKQTERGFYDPALPAPANAHYIATTIANVSANINSCASSYWANDGAIVTTMCGYDQSYREWILTLATPGVANDYPFLIESLRAITAYPGQRGCLSQNGTANVQMQVDGAGGTCYPSDANARRNSSFQVLLGTQQVKWSGAFSVD